MYWAEQQAHRQTQLDAHEDRHRWKQHVRQAEQQAQAEREAFEAKWHEAEDLRGQLGVALNERDALRSEVETLRQQQSMEREREKSEGLQRAARLLRTELGDIRNKVENFTKNRTVPEGFSFPAFEWQKYRAIIAGDQELYGLLGDAYTASHRVNEVIEWRRTVSKERLIGVNQNDGLIEAGAKATAALAALTRFLANDRDGMVDAAAQAYSRDYDTLLGKISAWGPLDIDPLRLAVDSELEQEELDNQAVRVTLRLLVTNSETDRDVSLEFKLAISNERGQRVFLAYSEQQESLPLRVNRMDDAKIVLSFLIMPSVLNASYDTEKYRWFPKSLLRLSVFDRISGRYLNLPLPASHRPERTP